MDIIKELNKKFDKKYSFLKLQDVIFSITNNSCVITFLYPENIDSISNEDKQEIEHFINTSLGINATPIIKYKKSYLEEDLIQKECMNYLDKNHKSIFTEIKANNFEISKQDLLVDIRFSVNEKLFSYIDIKIKQGLLNHLEQHFCGNFSLAVSLKQENNEDNLEKRKMSIISKIENERHDITRRYEVQIIKKVVGRDISPKPEFIVNVKGVKNLLIVAGVISNFTRRTFIQKQGKNKGEDKAYYTFNITDETGSMNAIYFCSKTNEKQMDCLENGQAIVVLGDYRQGYNKHMTLNINSITLCVLPEKAYEKETRQKSLSYQCIFPKKYVEYEQAKLFDKETKYSDFIMNNTFVIYDLETTGLDFNSCEIIEIGAVKIIDGKITDIFQTLVKPVNEISEIATQINGISNEMVEYAPGIEEVLCDFYIFCKDAIIGGYNSLNFDNKFLYKNALKVDLEFNNQMIDVMKMVEGKVRSVNYKLGTVAKALEITLDNAHRALFDAAATAKILLKINEI